jgi:very-short-patch-repair endonuclease
LIEDLLDKARAQNPAIEPFFAEDAAEPVVVKNLETVQGDERDIVLLGIGYGPETPDAPSMPMNFGPLNRAGGWRRLNVAITRARREMLVYTSFPPHLIDLNRTASEALRDLKHFLEFAEQGPRALGQAIAGSLGGYESPFEEAVAEGLRNLGWSIVPQVGVSRYRVDLGIVHPDRPGDYLVGVECDGAMYHSAATARDRDKVRESVLRQLGWKLLRVWSTDWWIDRKAALQQLHARLEVLLTERRDVDQKTECKRLEQEALAESAEQFVNLDSLNLISPVDVSERVYPELSAESKELVLVEFKNSYPDMKSVERPAENLGYSGEQVSSMVEQEPAQQFSPLDGQNSFTSPASSAPVEELPIATTSSFQIAHEPNSAPTTFQQGVYRATAFDDEKSFLQPDQFFEASYSIQLAEFIAKIVHQENPVKDDVLVERIARAHGFLRSGNRIRERVLSLTQSAHHLLTEEGGATFVWLDVETASSWNLARYPQTNDDCRSIEDIALVELAAAFPKIDPGAHVTQVARNFGVKRLSVQARSRLERAYAVHSGSV